MPGPHLSPASWTRPVRGLRRPGDPRVWGTIVGAIGASVFVMANRGACPSPWPVAAVLAWAGAFVTYVWFVFARKRIFAPVEPVRPRAGVTYLGSVVGMLVLTRLGAALLEAAGRVELRPALIVMAVGLHFLPFAKAFHTPMFVALGSIMAVLGAVGLGLGWMWDPRAAKVSAVIAGITMLVVISTDAACTRPSTR